MSTATPDPQLEALLVYLRDSRGIDFTDYKRPSLTRLIDRRLRTAGVSTYADYQDLIEVEPAELAHLLDVLLINVTSAFRDPQTWDALRTQLLPSVLEAHDPDEPIRVWSAACASGEEAYTLAILLHDLLGDAAYKARVKVFATDIDDAALAVARAGRYAADRLEGLTQEQRDTYFEPDGDLLRFRADLRPSIIFGRHDLLQDAPISRVLLLSCRNALMYFTSEAQARVLERFSYALLEHGLLVLGKAEMLLSRSQLFAPVDLGHRVFRSRRSAGPARLAALAVGAAEGADVVQRATLAAFGSAPIAQLVLDARGVVTLLNQRAERELGLTADDVGRPFAELPAALHPLELRGAVAAAQFNRQVVQLPEVPLLLPDGSNRRTDVLVAPLLLDGEVLGVHMVFEDVAERYELRQRLEQQERDLSTAYEELQSSNEELETTNEELQSAVEELETTNEELQSSNEELETMNEELQSTNEELQTLNDELRERTLDVDRVNSFLQSILGGLDLAVVVVDVDERVQLWNPVAERVTGLRAFEAEGKRLLELPLDVPAETLRPALRGVLLDARAADPFEVEVTTRFGRRHVRRVTASPLRRSDGEVLGGVVTFTDLVGPDHAGD